MAKIKRALGEYWFAAEFTYVILNGWSVEFTPIDDGDDLQVHLSKCGKHAYQIISLTDDTDLYLMLHNVIENLRQEILKEFPYVKK